MLIVCSDCALIRLYLISSSHIETLLSLLQATRIRSSDMRRRCTVALTGVNCSKNRYTDVVPCTSLLYVSIT